MTREFILLPEFDKRWKSLKLSDEQLRGVQDFLCLQPDAGALIEGTGGLRKVRWSFPGSGKRGGLRILYLDLAAYEKTYLISVFKKNRQITLSAEEKTLIKQVVNAIKDEVRRKGQ